MAPQSDLPHLVRRGTGAVFAAQVASQLMAVVGLACLSRLVAPAAFGLIGVALPIVMVPRMAATLGFSMSAIQDSRADDTLFSALFWRSLLWSLVAMLTTTALGAMLAWLYHMPDLTFVAAGLGVGTLLNAFSIVHLAILERQMQLRTAAFIRIASQFVATIAAIATALLDWGVGALLVQHVGEMVVLAVGVWSLSSWRPSLLHRNLPQETRRFGSLYALSSVMFYAAQNVDKLLLLAWLGSSPRAQALLGMYAQAYSLMMRPVYFITNPVLSVALPTLARVRHDAEALAAWTERFYRLTALMLMPAGVGLWLVAEDLMPLLAPRWPASGEILATLTPIILAQGLLNLGNGMLAAVKRSGILCWLALVQLILRAQAAWGGASFAASDYALTAEAFQADDALYHQTLGAATAVSLVTLLGVVPYTALAFYLAGVPLARFFRAVALPLAASVAMGVMVHLLHQLLVSYELTSALRLALCIPVGVLVYAVLTWSTWRALWRSAEYN